MIFASGTLEQIDQCWYAWLWVVHPPSTDPSWYASQLLEFAKELKRLAN